MKKIPPGGSHHANHRTYLLSDTIFCSKCGAALIGASKVGEHHYYCCQTNKSQGGCIGKFVRADHLEEKILGILKEKLLSIDINALVEERLKEREEFYIEQQKMVEALQDELNQVQKGIDNLTKFLSERVAVKEIKERIKSLQEQKHHLTEEIRITERANEIDRGIDREGLKYFIGELKYFIERAEKYPNKMNDLLKGFIRVDFDIETKQGKLTVNLRHEREKAIPFDVSEERDSSI
ncbi:MAG: recombinase zinc beta ribbon domain-containing protein [Vulcanimicrobiota bacterium]